MDHAIDIILSMDWEGISLDPRNLKKIRDFNNHYQLPWVHYLNPAYFTHPELKNDFVSKKIADCLFAGDELGLHLHAPRHLVEAAGVSFKSFPSFSAQGDGHTGSLQGQEVMLHAYTAMEFKKLVVYSYELLAQKGFDQLKSFRAGGWMINPDQVQALADMNFLLDSSAVAPDFFKQTSWQGENLHRYSQLLWEGIDLETLPFWAGENKSILEIPNNLGAIDYWSDEKINYYLETCADFEKQNRSKLLVITAHQETFCQYSARLEDFLKKLQSTEGLRLNFKTNTCVLEQLEFQKQQVAAQNI